MKLNREEFRDKVLGCWLGKNIGGTLGAPMEWYRQINDVSFYIQELAGEPLPNDDLDFCFSRVEIIFFCNKALASNKNDFGLSVTAF